jgi:hypothetical protein
MKTLWLAVVLTILLTSCAKIVVVKVDPASRPEAAGVFYALPRTVVRVQMKINKTTVIEAPFQKFAAIFAPEGNPVCKMPGCAEEKSKIYSIEKTATFETRGVPDPSQIYLVQFEEGGLQDQTVTMGWNEAGVPTTATASVTNRTADAVIATVKSVAGIGMRAAGYGGGALADKKPLQSCPRGSSNNDRWVGRVLSDNNNLGRQALLLFDNWCAIDLDDRSKNFNAGDEAALTQAVNAYVLRVLPLVKSHADLLTGQTQSFEPAAVATKLETQIDAQVKALYLGSKETVSWQPVMNLVPQGEGPLDVISIQAKDGVCPINDVLAVESPPMPPKFKAVTCDKKIVVAIAYEPKKEDQLFYAVQANTTLPTGALSFRYRIPAMVRASLKAGDEEYGAAAFAVAQMGHVAALPASRNSKGMGYDLAFIESTGGLKSFKLATTGGLDAATIDSAAGIANSILDARAKEAQKSDELTLLKRESDILDLKKKICEAQKALNEPCRFAQ